MVALIWLQKSARYLSLARNQCVYRLDLCAYVARRQRHSMERAGLEWLLAIGLTLASLAIWPALLQHFEKAREHLVLGVIGVIPVFLGIYVSAAVAQFVFMLIRDLFEFATGKWGLLIALVGALLGVVGWSAK